MVSFSTPFLFQYFLFFSFLKWFPFSHLLLFPYFLFLSFLLWFPFSRLIFSFNRAAKFTSPYLLLQDFFFYPFNIFFSVLILNGGVYFSSFRFFPLLISVYFDIFFLFQVKECNFSVYSIFSFSILPIFLATFFLCSFAMYKRYNKLGEWLEGGCG